MSKTAVFVPGEATKAFKAIRDERERQNEKWGVQTHSLCGWIAVLTEEVGEAAREALDIEINPKPGKLGDYSDAFERFRKEMVQVAAVAVQILEYLDRDELPF